MELQDCELAAKAAKEGGPATIVPLPGEHRIGNAKVLCNAKVRGRSLLQLCFHAQRTLFWRSEFWLRGVFWQITMPGDKATGKLRIGAKGMGGDYQAEDDSSEGLVVARTENRVRLDSISCDAEIPCDARCSLACRALTGWCVLALQLEIQLMLQVDKDLALQHGSNLGFGVHCKLSAESYEAGPVEFTVYAQLEMV